MSKNYIQVLELASILSKEECIMLIKDISSALVEDTSSISIPSEVEAKMLKSALEVRAKIRAGEMKTWSLKNAANSGTPMSIETFKNRIARSEEDILNGKTSSTEEVINRLKNKMS